MAILDIRKARVKDRQMPPARQPTDFLNVDSLLSDTERDELDQYLSATLKEDESEAMADCLLQLEDLLGDHPHALELLEHVRQDIARTALRCIEHSYRFGKRRGQREALEMRVPYIRVIAPAL